MRRCTVIASKKEMLIEIAQSDLKEAFDEALVQIENFSRCYASTMSRYAEARVAGKAKADVLAAIEDLCRRAETESMPIDPEKILVIINSESAYQQYHRSKMRKILDVFSCAKSTN
jgi:hypothetical protein